MNPKTYTYLDGSGNQYNIQDDMRKTIEYIPIEPLNSSSGIYDGGEYVKKGTTIPQFNEIKSILIKATLKKEIHIKDRVKMSGMIIIHDKGKRKAYILDPYSEEKHLIEKKLREIFEI